ncbi:unnamed protein product [Citrullus colocynthis]|uniref:Uncharacterized protein n=1 Tax=Citrullus colocynthis TaxID=252529 RepID=A0ABP0XQY5_9ROSI
MYRLQLHRPHVDGILLHEVSGNKSIQEHQYNEHEKDRRSMRTYSRFFTDALFRLLISALHHSNLSQHLAAGCSAVRRRHRKHHTSGRSPPSTAVLPPSPMQMQIQSTSNEVVRDLYALLRGPDIRISSYTGCIINGVRFNSKDRDDRCTTQNNGAQLKTMEFMFLVDMIVMGSITMVS